MAFTSARALLIIATVMCVTQCVSVSDTTDDREALLEEIEVEYNNRQDLYTYSPEERKKIVARDADVLESEIDETAEIAEGVIMAVEAIFGTGDAEVTDFLEGLREMVEEVKQTEDEYIEELKAEAHEDAETNSARLQTNVQQNASAKDDSRAQEPLHQASRTFEINSILVVALFVLFAGVYAGSHFYRTRGRDSAQYVVLDHETQLAVEQHDQQDEEEEEGELQQRM